MEAAHHHHHHNMYVCCGICTQNTQTLDTPPCTAADCTPTHANLQLSNQPLFPDSKQDCRTLPQGLLSLDRPYIGQHCRQTPDVHMQGSLATTHGLPTVQCADCREAHLSCGAACNARVRLCCCECCECCCCCCCSVGLDADLLTSKRNPALADPKTLRTPAGGRKPKRSPTETPTTTAAGGS